MDDGHISQGRRRENFAQKISASRLACLLLPVALWVTPVTTSPGAPPGKEDRADAIERLLQRADSWEIVPGKGPFEYGRVSGLMDPPGREGRRALFLYSRGRTGFQLRLRTPLRLIGFVSELRVTVLGSGAGETVYALFRDRVGRNVRIPLCRLDQPTWQSLTLNLPGRLRHRPERISEEAWVEFVGWYVEPDLRRDLDSSYLLFEAPTFQVEPYRMDAPAP